MAEVYGRVDGICKGLGGSMHVADFSKGIIELMVSWSWIIYWTGAALQLN